MKSKILLLKAEFGLLLIFLTTLLFIFFGEAWLADLSNTFRAALLFTWIFLIMLLASFAVVRHADCIAFLLGEPYGTLILTISVISIEVITISAVMLTGENNPTLGRDMLFSVLMIVLNGMIGFSLLYGGLHHVEQSYNLRGANTYLAVLIPLSVLGLILPNFNQATSDNTMSTLQSGFLIIVTLGLYFVFLVSQTIRHSDYFVSEKDDDDHHEGLIVKTVSYHAVFLIAYMIPIVLLSKKLAILVDFGLSSANLPVAFGGLLVAILVLSPEAMASFKAAQQDKIQRSINIGLGSALATIGLTIPAVLVIGMVTGKVVILGLGQGDMVLLFLTLIVSMVNFSSGKSNIIQGLIHLILFATYIIMIFD